MKLVALACMAGTLALTACGGGTGAAAPAAVTQTVIRETVTVAPPPPSSAPAPAAPAAAPAPAPTTATAPETFKMPTVVGMNLQLAQDTLQNLGSYLLDQEDALGLSRLQVNDSNWKVCSQTPKAGTKVPVETVVLLSSVKLTESCP